MLGPFLLKVLDMCNYKTWYYEEKNGYVIECSKCKNLQVGFGNVMLTLDSAEFDELRKLLIMEQKKVQCTVIGNVKHIFIATPCAGVTLLLNNGELNELCNMLDKADTEMKAAQLLELFYRDNI